MLYQFLASPPLAATVSLPLCLSVLLPRSCPPRARGRQPPIYLRVSSLKTVNSARHQGECELARAVLSAPIKMAMKKTSPFRRIRHLVPARPLTFALSLSLLAFSLSVSVAASVSLSLSLWESGVTLNGSYACIDRWPSVV